MKTRILFIPIILALLFALPTLALADNYTYPAFSCNPNNGTGCTLAVNGVATLLLTTQANSNIPSGAVNWFCVGGQWNTKVDGTGISGGSCSGLPLVPPGPACDDSNPAYAFQGVVFTQVLVYTPGDPSASDVYMLGTASGPGISGSLITVTSGTQNLPFGPGQSPVIGSNTYQWWRISLNGNPVYPNQNIISYPSPSPTGLSGIYFADFEGYISCGSGPVNFHFDIGFILQTSSLSPPTVSKTVTPSLTRTYSWTITKSVDNPSAFTAGGAPITEHYTVTALPAGSADSGFQTTGTITVTNPNGGSLLISSVTDSDSTVGPCSVATGSLGDSPAGPFSLSGGQTETFGFACAFSSNPGTGGDTATVAYPGQGGLSAGSATYTATYDFNAAAITPVHQTVTVTDTLGGSLGTCDALANPAGCTYNYPYTFTDPAGTCTTHPNTATIVETGQTATASVTDCQGADLTVTKTITPASSATYSWGITKQCSFDDVHFSDNCGPTNANGSPVTVYYDVVATNTGTTVAWSATGTITVTNPNNWEAVTFMLSDSISTGSCTISGGTGPYTVAASGSATFTFSCTFPSGAGGTNTATATWSASTYHTPDGSASGSANFSFGAPTTTANSSVTVTDTFNGGSPTTLGTCTVLASPCTFAFSQTYNLTPDQCLTATDTAKVVGDNGIVLGVAVSTAQECQSVSGFLTMGFWKGPNGQRLISNDASTGGVCNSVPYIRQFQDFNGKGTYTLSATASCSKVATFVSTVLGAAKCSGTCVAMADAQMLATALDVYFSASGSYGSTSCNIGVWSGASITSPGTYSAGSGAPYCAGGDKISAYNGGVTAFLGNANVDLTNIPGTGSVSSTFGGNPSLSVFQLLAFTNQFIGPTKATYSVAASTFDSINNDNANLSP